MTIAIRDNTLVFVFLCVSCAEFPTWRFERNLLHIATFEEDTHGCVADSEPNNWHIFFRIASLKKLLLNRYWLIWLRKIAMTLRWSWRNQVSELLYAFGFLLIPLDHWSPYCHQLEVSFRFRMDFVLGWLDELNEICSALWFFFHWIFDHRCPVAFCDGYVAQWFFAITHLSVLALALMVWSTKCPLLLDIAEGEHEKSSCHNQIALSKCVMWHQVEQHQHLRPFFYREWTLCQYVCELSFRVHVLNFDCRVQVGAIIEPVQIHSMSPWYVSHRRASSFVCVFRNRFVVFEDVQRCLFAKELCVGVLQSMLLNKVDIVARSFECNVCRIVLLTFGCDTLMTVSHEISVRIPATRNFRFNTTMRYRYWLFAHPWYRNKCVCQRFTEHCLSWTWNLKEFRQNPRPGINPIWNQLLCYPHNSTVYHWLKNECSFWVLQQAFCRKLCSILWLVLPICSVHNILGRPIRAIQKHYDTIGEHVSGDSPTDSMSSTLSWWSSRQIVETFVKLVWRSTHLRAWPSMS